MINYEFCKLQFEALNNKEVLIHASAVAKNDKSIIFCGPTESGKTRYMIEFCKNGWKCLGDDFVLIKKGYCYGNFLEPCHMKYESGFRIPIKKLPLHYFYKLVRLITCGGKKPHVFLTPKELGIKTTFKAKLNYIVFLGKIEGETIEEKIFNNTKTKGGFDEYAKGLYLPLMYEIIKENLNENTLTETTIDLARQL